MRSFKRLKPKSENTEKEAEPEAEAAPVEGRPYGDRLIDKLTTSSYLLPLVVIVGALILFGARGVFFVAFIGGCYVWWKAAKKMRPADCKLVLIVDITKGEITPLGVGRRRWAAATKIGRPFLSFQSSSGQSVEVVQDYCRYTNTVTYPSTEGYSDIEIAAIPLAYKQMIEDYVRINTEYADMKMNGERKAWELTRKHNKQLSQIFAELLAPTAAEGGKE